MPLTQETFQTVVLEDTDGRWELHRGRLQPFALPSITVEIEPLFVSE